MLVHCSYCEAVESVSTSHLQHSYRNVLTEFAASGETPPNSSEGMPYTFEEIVFTISEALPAWDVRTHIEGNVEELVLACPKHQSKLDAIIAEIKKSTPSIAPKEDKPKSFIKKAFGFIGNFLAKLSAFFQRLSDR